MSLHWVWIPLAALGLLVVYQQSRISRIHRDVRKREELFQIVTENAADMIALVDVKGHRLYNSPAYRRILGYSAAELGETSAFEQIHPDDRFRVLEAAREARETGIGKQLEYRIKHKDGTWRVLESVASVIRDDKGQVAKLVIVNRDISARKRMEQSLEHSLFHDPLTGLSNRRHFLDRLQRSFERSTRDAGYQYALLLANLDHFKVFNETLGTAAGDLVLVQVAKRLEAGLRQDDPRAEGKAPGEAASLSRLGGDEFIILLDGVSDPSGAMRVAKRIQAAIAEPVFLEAREVRASLSLGIALSTQAHERPEGVLRDADVAMRRARSLGGSRCEVFDEAMHTQAIGRMRLEADLQTALTEHQFLVYYQPIVQLDTGRIESFEALLRWNHPTQGLISPARFIGAAEDTGILVSIGHWLLHQACRELRQWRINHSNEPPAKIALNLSARQFADPRLASDIQDALRQTSVDPSRLQLEITETVAAADSKLTMTVLSHLKHMGIAVILDDFGVGSASLRALWQFPVEALKIDRALVMEMQTDRGACDIIEMIILLAHKMNLRVVAEGVETTRQFERLRELGCELGQGYFFSQPLEAKAAQEFRRNQAVLST